MIEKDKKYTYDELKEIFRNAERDALEKVEDAAREASDGDTMFIITQSLSAMVNYGFLFNKLFSDEEKEN